MRSITCMPVGRVMSTHANMPVSGGIGVPLFRVNAPQSLNVAHPKLHFGGVPRGAKAVLVIGSAVAAWNMAVGGLQHFSGDFAEQANVAQQLKPVEAERPFLIGASKKWIGQNEKIAYIDAQINEAKQALKDKNSSDWEKVRAKDTLKWQPASLKKAHADLLKASDAVVQYASPYLDECVDVANNGSSQALQGFLNGQVNATKSAGDKKRLAHLESEVVDLATSIENNQGEGLRWGDTIGVCRSLLNTIQPYTNDAQKREIVKTDKALDALKKQGELNPLTIAVEVMLGLALVLGACWILWQKPTEAFVKSYLKPLFMTLGWLLKNVLIKPVGKLCNRIG